MTWANKGQ